MRGHFAGINRTNGHIFLGGRRGGRWSVGWISFLLRLIRRWARPEGGERKRSQRIFRPSFSARKREIDTRIYSAKKFRLRRRRRPRRGCQWPNRGSFLFSIGAWYENEREKVFFPFSPSQHKTTFSSSMGEKKRRRREGKKVFFSPLLSPAWISFYHYLLSSSHWYFLLCCSRRRRLVPFFGSFFFPLGFLRPPQSEMLPRDPSMIKGRFLGYIAASCQGSVRYPAFSCHVG